MIKKKTIRKIWRRIAARPSFRKINELMFDCALRGLGVLNYEDDAISGEVHFIEQLLPLYIDEATPVIIDAGANVGDYTKYLLSAHPNASIHAFEPNPKTYAKLEQALSGTTVITENRGLGATDATLKFYDRVDRDGSSGHGTLYREVIEGIHEEKAVELEVSITTLDAYAKAKQIESIKLLKIDTEGHELEVIKGAAELIRNDQVDLIQIEFNEMNVVSRIFLRDFVKALPNYIGYRLLPKGVLKLRSSPYRTEIFGYQNIIFVNRKFAPKRTMKPQQGVKSG